MSLRVLVLIIAIIAVILALLGIGIVLSGVTSIRTVVAPTPTPTVSVTPTPTPTFTPTPTPTSTPIPTPTLRPEGGGPPNIIIIPRDRDAAPTHTPTPTFTPTPTPTPTPPLIVVPLFPVGRFGLAIPDNWGILRCTNSANFELDPFNNIDQSAICNVALKPVTVILQNSFAGCSGETVILGETSVVRSITQKTNFIEYQWCVNANPVLRITHRVSPIPSRAVSTVDFSADIESMIARSSFSF